MKNHNIAMRVIRYSDEWKEKWDEFISSSKNGTFLLMRNYMEYHKNRFEDCSLIILDEKDNIVTLLPATRHGDSLRSHGGLTYGGFVMSTKTNGEMPMQWLEMVEDYMRENGLNELIYKPIPHIYHRQPSEEDIYALFRAGATMSVCNLATVINLADPIVSSRIGKRAVKRQRQTGITVEEVNAVSVFWQIIVEDRRERHNTTPVHNLEEMERLHGLFPQNIRLFAAKSPSGEVLAGAVIYVAGGVLHLQYAAATSEGKDLYAVDIIYHEVINRLMPGYKWFDFGTSNEDAGRYLNVGMVHHKEEMGGRSIVYPMFTLNVERVIM
jgi:hypothetical protein